MKHETTGTCDQVGLHMTVDTLAQSQSLTFAYVVELQCIVYTAGRYDDYQQNCIICFIFGKCMCPRFEI